MGRVGEDIMAGNAREVALLTLSACEKQGAWSDLALKKNIHSVGLDGRDAALATRLCFGVLQNRMLLDFYIGKFSSVRVERMENRVLNALRLGVYQMAFLTRIPVSAAVNESVTLSRKYSKNPRSPGLVNGILRAVSRNMDHLPLIEEKDPARYLSIRYSHPLWLVREFLDALGEKEAERLLAFCNNSNPVFLISVLGVGVFGSVRAGVWLWLIHVLSALLTGLVFRGSGKSASRQELTRHPPFRAVSFAEAFTGAVRSSLAGILSVCAFVVFFYVLAQPLTAVGGRLGAVLVAALELFSLTPLLTADAFGFLLAAAAAGWGGLSVLCQTLAVLEGSGLRLRNCFLGKVVQSAFSLLLAALLVGYVLG